MFASLTPRPARIFTGVPIATVDQGYVYLPTVGMPSYSVLTQQLMISANQVKATQFVLPFRLKVSDIQVYVSTGVGGGLCGCGIYSADGGTLLLQSGPMDATSSSRKKATLDPAITLEAGAYWYAWTLNSEDIRLAALNNSTYVNTLFYDTNPQMGKATNVSSGCNLPSTLGTITFETTMKIPIALMKP